MNRKKSFITLGPGASSLILIFVVLSLASLGMLSQPGLYPQSAVG